jgi:hypothetical protein
MIELNCSYEESKKILDLGYDFSKVCREFELHRHGMFLRKIKLTNDCFALLNNEDSEEFAAELDYTSLESVLVDGFAPIIPKDALAKCLPEFETNKAWFSMVKDNYSEARTHYWVFETPKTIPQSDTWNRRPRMLMRYVKNQMLYENLHSAYFKSAFKAFTWCHEHYPEELKKKFDEVMG